MIIEFFGPPCVGKTTLARTVFSQLEDRGYDTRLVSSYRPAETGQKVDHSAIAALQRLVRAVVETGALMRSQTARADQANVASALLRLMPPDSVTWSLRMYQYLARLVHNWRIATADSKITVFDQAFVQAVYSLASLNRRLDRSHLDDALSLIPMPDLLVRLGVPDDILCARLAQRQRAHGRLERLLEISPEINLASVPIFNTLDEMLLTRNLPIIYVEADGQCRLETVLSDIEDVIQIKTLGQLEGVAG